MKKLKHESELFKAGLLAAMKYAQDRGAVEFEPTDSASQKLLYVYRLLVHDKMIQPLPEDQVGYVLGVVEAFGDLAATGAFAPPVPVDDGASPEAKLVALTGRRPR